MKVYKCPRCGHVTDKLSNYKAHITKKFTCKDKNNCGKTPEEILNNLDSNNLNICEYKCCGCLEKFNTIQIISSHKTTCRSYELFMKLQVTEERIKEKEERIKEKEERIKELENQLLQFQNANININLNNFGEEDTSHISDEFLNNCLIKLSTGIPSIVERIYFDSTKTENRTVLLSSSKKEQVKIYTDGKWTIKSFHEIIPIMIIYSADLIYNHYINSRLAINMRELDQNKYKYAKFKYITDIRTGNKNKKYFRELIKSVKSILENNR
jgi:hypothetical protein